jgi:hypothetical protein
LSLTYALPVSPNCVDESKLCEREKNEHRASEEPNIIGTNVRNIG